MSTTQTALVGHTCGPWIAKASVNGSGDIGIVSHGGDVAKAACVAEVFSDLHRQGERSQETLPNARLIAAAPDLLAALEAADNYLNSELSPHNALMVRIGAALASAKGLA